MQRLGRPLSTKLLGTLITIAWVGSAAGCGGEEIGGPGRERSTPGGLAPALGDRDDPIARWLRVQETDDDGHIVADYKSMLLGIAEVQGCDEDTIQTFVISDDLITGADPFPRLVSTACSNDPRKASEFFTSASFEKATPFGAPTGEVDTRALELFAWDRRARQYRFYATEPVGSDRDSLVEVEIEPDRCMGCHRTPSDLADSHMHALPIMNELTLPWSHWQAEPSFPNHQFEVPDRLDDSETLAELAAAFPGSAAELEPIIRAGQERVLGVRARARRNDADLSETMSLIRPLFCDEQVNYVSEDFDSGDYENSVFVDGGVRGMFTAVRANWPWEWANGTIAKLTRRRGKPVELIPVRGNANILMEGRLVATGVLTAMEVLQVRALDWQEPALSDFRCGLFKDALKRFRKASQRPDLSGAESNADAASIVLAEILTIEDEDGERQPLLIGDNESLLVIPAAAARSEPLEELAAAIASGEVEDASCKQDGFCLQTLEEWGSDIDARIRSFTSVTTGRSKLKKLRDERLCRVTQVVKPADKRFPGQFPLRFQNRPALPGFSCK